VDDLGLVEAVDGFGESVVVAVADAADGRFEAASARRSAASEGRPVRTPLSTSAFFTHSLSACAVQPIFAHHM
jgi:hypothetical protein